MDRTPDPTPDPRSRPRPRWPFPGEADLIAAGNGQWRKRLKGQDFYFGSVEDPAAALERWRKEWPDIVAGRRTRTATRSSSAPKWPYPREVILTAAASGQWRKRYRGRDYYFGPVEDPAAAIERWRKEWPDIVAGRPRGASVLWDAGGPSVLQTCTAFLDDRRRRLDEGELAQVTWLKYQRLANEITETLGGAGGARPVGTLGPLDFMQLRRRWNGHAPTTIADRVTLTRVLFDWAADTWELSPPRYGKGFKVPGRRTLRRAKRATGPRLITAPTAIRLIGAADPLLRACILLALNTGMGAAELADLRLAELPLFDPEPVLRRARQKTQAEQVAPLWPETAVACRLAVMPSAPPTDPRKFRAAHRRAAQDGLGLAFRTRTGRALVHQGGAKGANSDAVNQAFTKLAAKLKLDPAPSFYDLRRTMITVAQAAPLPRSIEDHAAKILAGHVVEGVHESYVQEFPIPTLRTVTDHVRAWLFAPPKSTAGRAGRKAQP